MGPMKLAVFGIIFVTLVWFLGDPGIGLGVMLGLLWLVLDV